LLKVAYPSALAYKFYKNVAEGEVITTASIYALLIWPHDEG
jgi:hypothetical protein